jgi:hypothetical protein
MGKNGGWESFIGALREDTPVFGFFKVVYLRETRLQEKNVLLLWSPDSSRVKDRMWLASSKRQIREQFKGIDFEFAGCQKNDLDLEVVKEACLRSCP